MGKKASKLAGENQRVRYLLDFLFDGNQSKMADALGIPQPVISRVVTGKLRPGKQLIAALTGHPKVNPAWLATGKGDPLLAAEASSSEGWPVPVASCLLPGRPADCKMMLKPIVHYVPGATYRDSLYAVKAHGCVPRDITEPLHILPDDLLLIESDPAAWVTNIGSLNGRLTAVRFEVDGVQEIVLREVQVTGQAAKRTLTVLSVPQIRERLAREAQAEKDRQDYGREQRDVMMRDESSTQSKSKRSMIEQSQIVGLVVQLVRNF